MWPGNALWYSTRSRNLNCESNVMIKRKSQTDFIRALILHGDSAERDSLLQRMGKAEHDEHSSRCALILVIVLSVVSVSAVCYGAVLLPDFFHGGSNHVIKFFCGLGLASMICSVVFSGCWLWYRSILNRLHRESRRFLLGILETQSKPGHPQLTSLLNGDHSNTGEEPGKNRTANRNQQGYLDLFSLRRVS